MSEEVRAVVLNVEENEEEESYIIRVKTWAKNDLKDGDPILIRVEGDCIEL